MNIEELYDDYSDYVFRYIYGMVENKAEAEDLLQDTFMKVIKSGVEEIRNPKSYLITIARNTVYDHWRVRKEKVSLDPLKEEGKSVDLDLKMDIEEAIKNLTPKLREVVILRELNQLDYREIAEILDVELGTVKSRLNRARRQLREFLTE